MRKFIKRLLIFILVAVLVYIAWFSFVIIEKGTIGTLRDTRSNKIVRLLFQRYNFVWQGSLPWIFSVQKIPSSRNAIIEVKVPIPPLESLTDNQYHGKISVNLLYRIMPDKFFDISKLEDDGKALDSVVSRYVDGYVQREIYDYLVPLYRLNEIRKNNDIILKNAHDKLKEKFESIGLSIIKFDFIGSLTFPDMKTYYSGLTHINELRKIAKINEKELKLLRNKLKRDKILNEQQYNKLLEISKIIKENPDMLKYLYIEKMADNVRVIISSDSSGYPLDLGKKEEKKQETTTTGEIDNLR